MLNENIASSKIDPLDDLRGEYNADIYNSGEKGETFVLLVIHLM